ncbi:GumC domain-containing protein [Streptomyces apocyni]|uniref:TPM domain-containing protein n=1 Tax=Streptomyces apocyni TaxID=2654677 RepID=UPI0012EA9150|nr:TPM domain-containing protein [Streptomyces apocyni]
MTSTRSLPRRAVRAAGAALLAAACWLAPAPAVGAQVSEAARVGGPAPVSGAAQAPGPAQGPGEELGGDVVLPVIAVGCAGALAAYAYVKRRRRAATRTTPGGQAGAVGPPPAPVAELDAESRRLLVRTDDAILTSAEELGFAKAQFGDAAVRPFARAVAHAREELTVAFRVRQRLDDAPGDDPTSRRMLREIIARCGEAGARLDAASAGFDQLRALERTLPDALDHAERVFREVAGRTDIAEATYGALAARYTGAAVAPVSGRVGEAKARLVFTTAQLGEARQALAAGDRGAAAGRLRAAESAVDQAGTLVDSVDRLARELAEATGRLPGALADTESDLADARGLLTGTTTGTPSAELREHIARAEAAVAEVREDLAAGRHDPVGALRRVAEADAALDQALARAREKSDPDRGARHALLLLDRAVLVARSNVGAVADHVTTHRGAVGSQARTRLAEARRHLDRAAALTSSAPWDALDQARQADALASQAGRLAARDVTGHAGVSGAPLGDAGTAAAILGGILLSGHAPASFGGSETRARRGAPLCA